MPPPCGRWPRRPPTWSAPSSASRRPAAPARRCWSPTPPTTPGGGRHERAGEDGAAAGVPLPERRRGAPLRRVPRAGRAAHHGAGRAAGHPSSAGSDPHPTPFLPARLLRHLRHARQRPGGARLRDPPGRARRPGGGRAPGRRAGHGRPGRRHRRLLRAPGAIRPPAGADERARHAGADGPRAVRGLHRVRPVPVGLPGRRHRPPLPGPGGAGRRRPAHPGAARRRPQGGARPGRRRPRRLALPCRVRVLGGLPRGRRPRRRDHAPAPAAAARPAAAAGRPARPGGAAMTGEELREVGGRHPSRWLDPRGRHLGTWAFVLNRLTGLGLVAYLYLHLIVLSTLLRGPEAWDGLVAVFRRPVFLALDVLLVLGLAVHGLNGLRMAQVVSGVLLLVLMTVHMVAQHFVVEGGLRTYQDVVAWIRNPVVFAVEALLLLTVTWHGIAGVHAVLLDLGLRGRAERIVARVLLGLAVVTGAYGLWLLAAIAVRG